MCIYIYISSVCVMSCRQRSLRRADPASRGVLLNVCVRVRAGVLCVTNWKNSRSAQTMG